jgi:hypothetical protein
LLDTQLDMTRRMTPPYPMRMSLPNVKSPSFVKEYQPGQNSPLYYAKKRQTESAKRMKDDTRDEFYYYYYYCFNFILYSSLQLSSLLLLQLSYSRMCSNSNTKLSESLTYPSANSLSPYPFLSVCAFISVSQDEIRGKVTYFCLVQLLLELAFG